MRSPLKIFGLLNAPCRDMTRLISRAMDEKLPFRERLAARIHLIYCHACQKYRKQLLHLRSGLQRAARAVLEREDAPLPGLSPSARERIKRAIGDR